ncbi:GLPGLI family protein [Flavobacterium sp. CS20]|uniref:GLPGLI family protein n=1 Tax=Flavobacterium sp. CS20 TaxID=2775246 RepID=UPI001B3A2A5B|nr:GLPGLI family protein [Flavobacterium sp. CS20]QTY27286.1 GLPGLI family protein [Flavobacterium sp. CS20]
MFYKLFFVITFFLFNITFSQNYLAKYNIVEIKKLKLNKKKDSQYNYVIKRMNNQISEYSNSLSIEIICNKNDYFYKIPNRLSIDENKNQYYKTSALSNIGIDENLLVLKNKIYFYYETDKFVTVLDEDVIDWHFTGKKKKIGNYNCIRVIPEFKENIKLGRKSKDISLWICPEINLKGGPFRFGNLPGLIVMMENSIAKFKLVELKETNQNIINLEEFTDNRKIISYMKAQEYQKKVGKMIESKFKN